MSGFYDDKLMPLSQNNLKIPKLYGFDIETADRNKKFLCLAVEGSDFQKQYFSKDAFLDELKYNRIFRNSFIVATNLMFDFFGLFPGKLGMKRAFDEFSILERQGQLIMAKTYIPFDKSKKPLSKERLKSKDLNIKDYYPVTFIDSLSHYKSSVDSMGKVIDVRKLAKPSFLGATPANSDEWKELLDYNKQDAHVTYEFMMWLAKMYNEMGCNLKMTISSTALDLMRRRYMPVAWKIPDRVMVNDAYKAYYGGRTEAFNRGIFEEKIRCYDANSLYPYCMKEFRYPIMETGYHKKKVTTDDIDAFMGFCEATLKAPDINIPLLPVRTSKLLFPVGTIKGWYDFASIKKAVEVGYEIKQLGKGWVYENEFSPFKSYIVDMYNKRKEFQAAGNPAELVTKLLMNSLYGKFGYQYKDKEIIMPDDLAEDAAGDVSIYPIGGTGFSRVATNTGARIPKYVFPAIPLYVTAYARIHMFNKMKDIGFDRVLYTDTDSIFTRKQIPTSTELGDFKLEKTFTDLFIIRPKFYGGKMLEGKSMCRIKGLGSQSYSVTDMAEMIKKGKLETNVTLFRKLRGSLTRDCIVNHTYDMHKSVELDDNKRIWEQPRISISPQSSVPIKL